MNCPFADLHFFFRMIFRADEFVEFLNCLRRFPSQPWHKKTLITNSLTPPSFAKHSRGAAAIIE
jgi:hypothetical protein